MPPEVAEAHGASGADGELELALAFFEECPCDARTVPSFGYLGTIPPVRGDSGVLETEVSRQLPT